MPQTARLVHHACMPKAEQEQKPETLVKGKLRPSCSTHEWVHWVGSACTEASTQIRHGVAASGVLHHWQEKNGNEYNKNPRPQTARSVHHACMPKAEQEWKPETL
eukprot:1149409-Pelagomonas_calceolata.AAC.2